MASFPNGNLDRFRTQVATATSTTEVSEPQNGRQASSLEFSEFFTGLVDKVQGLEIGESIGSGVANISSSIRKSVADIPDVPMPNVLMGNSAKTSSKSVSLSNCDENVDDAIRISMLLDKISKKIREQLEPDEVAELDIVSGLARKKASLLRIRNEELAADGEALEEPIKPSKLFGPSAAVYVMKKVISGNGAAVFDVDEMNSTKTALSWAEELDTPWSSPKFTDGSLLADSLVTAPTLPGELFADMLALDFDMKRVVRLPGIGLELALPRVALAIFNHYDLVNALRTDLNTFTKWCCAISSAYRSSNPYHNQVHAADVMLTANSYVIAAGVEQKLSVLERALLLLAAIIHDVGHPGRMNPYLAQTEPELALTYRHAPGLLEAFHAETGFAITRRRGQNIFEGLSEDDFKVARKTVLELVLATDLSQQSAVLQQWNSKKNDAGIFDLDLGARPEDRLLVMKMFIKAADVSNPAKSLRVYRDWTDAIMAEFYAQGDEERDLGMPVSAMPQCDRTKPALVAGQLGFISFVVKPIFTCLVDYFPTLQPTTDNIDSNISFWKACKERKDITDEGLCFPSDLPEFVWSYPSWPTTEVTGDE